MREYSVRQIIEATKGKLLCGDENTLIKDVVIDSRKAHPEALFVPIIGEKNDAHQFLPSVAEAGCKVSLVSKKEVSISEGMTYILVEDLRLSRILPMPIEGNIFIFLSLVSRVV